MKKLSFVVLLFSLIFIFAPNASALNSAVYFEGGADNFVTYPSEDLFDGFKSAMPGDKLTETVKIRNTAPEYDYVKIYLRAEAHDETANPLSESVAESETVATMSDFLAQLSMKVYEGENLIYEASPDQLDRLASNVLLGQFTNGAGTTLTVELDVPKTLGNEYAHRSGEVDWIFTAEGYIDGEPVNPDPGDEPTPGGNTEPEPLPDGTGQKPDSPFTFDSIVNYSIVFALSLIGLIVVAAFIKRQIKQSKLNTK